MDIKKTLIKLNYKSLLKRLPELAVEIIIMIVLTSAVISYSNKEFEIPFFPRDAEMPTVDIFVPASTAPAGGTTETPTEIPANVQHIINPDNFLAEAPNETGDVQGSETVFEHFSDLSPLGFKLTGEMYEHQSETHEYKFAEITPEHQPINSRRAVEPVMDYILIRDSSVKTVLSDASGKVIDQNFGTSGLDILHMRDSEERTVFVMRGTDEPGESEEPGELSYYVYDPGIRAYQGIIFDEPAGNRGADFMYPEYYGAPENGWETFRHTNGLWGYRSVSEENRRTINAQYDRAFNFSENIAAAYITTWRNQSEIGSRLYFHDEDGWVINSDFFAPDPIDEETNHLGFYYFDHGLTRVISKRIYVGWATTTTSEQREHLINTEFREFYTPPDYKITAYSNGMILLEKNGYFGFMNYLGEWIAQPVYTYAQPFFEGVAVIGMADGKKMLIDTQGNIIAKMQYDHISNCTSGIIALYERDAGWTILNKVRREIQR
ncbi:MAG: WG repeat-containing protein [Oscillospiraceae bacterium]|nr:WG repeat-containing protein [Oscillospiraceae bacterium]